MNYTDFLAAWSQLEPIPLDNLRGRWIGPLVDTRFDRHLADLAQAAYGYLSDCGWSDTLEELPEFTVHDRTLTPAWAEALHEAGARLAEAGSNAGPEGSREVWVSWLCFELAAPHEWLVETLAERDADAD